MWDPLGLELLGNCDPPDHIERTASVVNHWAISPAPRAVFRVSVLFCTCKLLKPRYSGGNCLAGMGRRWLPTRQQNYNVSGLS